MWNGERLRQAREILGMTQDDLATALGKDQSYISYLEQSAKTPSDETIEQIAVVTRFPKLFFQQESGPDFPLGSLLFRKRSGLSSPESARIRQTTRVCLEIFLALQQRVAASPLKLPRVGDVAPADAAQVLRSSLGYPPEGPIKALMSRLEKAGVLVVRLPLSLPSFSAFSAWSSEEDPRPIIALGGHGPGDRDRYTLAHELGHLVLHMGFLGDLSELEKEAKEFAGEFLLPEINARQAVETGSMTLTRLAELKSRWGVSMQFVLWRFETLDLLSPQQKSYWRGKLHKKGWLEVEPVPIPAEPPTMLKGMLEAAYGIPLDPRKVARDQRVSTQLIADLIAANSRAGMGSQPVKGGDIIDFLGTGNKDANRDLGDGDSDVPMGELVSFPGN